MRTTIDRTLIVGLLCSAAIFAVPAMADEVADFYKGKSVSIVVGHEAATGFDVYARVLARHLNRHIPGNPSIVVQNMVGASGINAANWLYNIAPKDGTVMATFVHTVPFEPLMGNKSAKYDASKFTWIGNMEESIAVCGISKASGFTKLDELKTKQAIFGATGATGPLVKSAAAVKNLLDLKMKIVSGYKGSTSVKTAIQRGEVHGICGLPMSTIRSSWGDMYDAGQFQPIIQLSGRKQPSLKGIPHVDDYAKTEDDRKLYGLIFGTQALGRIFLSPPGVPAARKKALREALAATMKDKQFLADAKKIKISVTPMTGDEVEEFIARLSTATPAIVERAKQVVRPN
ncbi:MAG: Bug family tripartite tricarboxylate transporter substrate binding protein [Xanthobacteraceae bacterium]